MTDEEWMVTLAKGSGRDGAPRDQRTTDAALAFEELFQRHKQPLYGFFRRRTHDPARAEELTQECFLAVLQSASRYRPTATFRTFLYAIGLNLVRADRRKSMFRAMFSGESKREPGADSGAEQTLILRDALGHLDSTDRELLMLREYEELTYAELAELLDIPVGTVRSRLFRARAELRTVLTSAPEKQFQTTLSQEGRA